MKMRKAELGDLKEIDKIYVAGSIDEEKLQFPEVLREEMIKDLDYYKRERQKGFKKGLTSKRQYWVVAEEGEETIGFGNAEIKKAKLREGKKELLGEINNIYIKRNFRGRGIAKKLEEGLFYWLKSKGIKKVFARVYAKNYPSIKLHGSLGFENFAITMMKRLK